MRQPSCTFRRGAHASTARSRGCSSTPARKRTALRCTVASSSAEHAKLQSHLASDVVCLGNLCVDVVMTVDELPNTDPVHRRKLLDELSRSPPDQSSWEVGGSTNFMIAASRLGLDVRSCGHATHDNFSTFLTQCLKAEGITKHTALATALDNDPLLETLICFVFVHKLSGQHAFCSRYDFGPWPLLPGFTASNVPPEVYDAVCATRAVMMNGFVFDELVPDVVCALADRSRRCGAAVFFDPGPRSSTLVLGDRRAALDAVLDVSSVVLLTEEEAEAITGCSNAEAAGRQLLDRPGCATKWVIVKRGPAGCTLVHRCTVSGGLAVLHQRGFSVDVKDTVGCGDSFAAAVVLGYTRGWRPQVVLALANAVGAATATRQGAGRNVASRDTVEALLRQGASSQDTLWSGDCSQALQLLTEAA